MSTFSLTQIAASLGVGLLLLLLQPLVLKLAVGWVGEKSPRYLRAAVILLATSLFSGMAGFTYWVTIGTFLGAASATLAAAGALAVSALVTSIVYSAFLRIAFVPAVKIALTHYVLGIAMSSVAGLALRFAFGG
jgi:hypothetical protein